MTDRPPSPATPWPVTDDEKIAFVDWQADVAEGNTTLGFRDWITHQIEANDEECTHV